MAMISTTKTVVLASYRIFEAAFLDNLVRKLDPSRSRSQKLMARNKKVDRKEAG